MQKFDVARLIVRQAIALLADEELLASQRGRGMFVTGKPGPRPQQRVETTLDAPVAMHSGGRKRWWTIARHVRIRETATAIA
jgi:DNA-binding GntR family transcriptional regulator